MALNQRKRLVYIWVPLVVVAAAAWLVTQIVL